MRDNTISAIPTSRHRTIAIQCLVDILSVLVFQLSSSSVAKKNKILLIKMFI